MNHGRDESFRHWQQLLVDVLVGAATIIVGFAAIGTGTDFLYAPLMALALVGTALMLEPDVTADRARHIGPLGLRLFRKY